MEWLIIIIVFFFLSWPSAYTICVTFYKGFEMPEDMESSGSDKEEEKKQKIGIHADIDLSRPLEPHENLPVQQHRVVVSAPKKEESPSADKKEKRRHRHKGENDERRRKDDKRRHKDRRGRERDRKSGHAVPTDSQPQEKPAHIRSYEAGPRLIDITSPKAPSSPALPVTTPASPSLGILDGLGFGSAANYDQISSPALGGASSPVPMSSSYASLPEVIPPATEPRKSSRSKKDRDGRRRKDDKSSRDKKNKKEKDIFADYEKNKKNKKEK